MPLTRDSVLHGGDECRDGARRRRRSCDADGVRAHPRHIPGCLTISELAGWLGVSRDWIGRRIRNGTIAATRDPAAGRFLFPDTDDTLASFAALKAGTIDHLDCTLSTNR
jgi:excisionase family DNA binding protein